MGPVRPPHPDQPRYAGDDLASAVLGPVEVALFENLYLAYHVDALRMAIRLLGDPEQAADAVHTAFLEMLRYVLSGRRWYEPGDAKAVVLRNTRWAALKLARDRRRRAELTADTIDELTAGGEDWARAEVRSLCEQVVQRLAPRHRQAIHLHFVEALPHANAGGRMGVSAEAFKKVLARAVRSARREARGIGVLPGIAPVPLLLGQLARARHAAKRICATSVGAAKVAAMAAAGGIVATYVAGLTTASAQHPPISATAARVGLDGIYESVVVDMVRPSASAQNLVLALGRGRRCGCWLVYRSQDSGASWQTAAGPTVVSGEPRLGVTGAFPDDGRIFVVDGGDGRPVAETAAFGDPFRAPVHPVPPLARVERVTDLTRQAAVVAGRYLDVETRGGRLCTRDGGRTWRYSCAPMLAAGR